MKRQVGRSRGKGTAEATVTFGAPLLASSGDLSMENRCQYYIYTSVNGNCKLDQLNHIHNCNHTWSFRES